MNTEKKHNLFSRMAYGAADIYGGGAYVVISTFYMAFLNKAQGMPAAMAGTIPLIGQVWDAVTDPIMGNICDRTKSRLGAKRFYILVGALLSAFTFILMWMTMPLDSMVTKYIFYAGMYILFSTGFTIVMVPYNALLPDMIDDYTERAGYSAVRMAFSTFGAILAGLIPTLLIRDNTNPASYLTVAFVFGGIFTAAILVTFFGTWERQKEPVRVPIKESFSQSLTVFKSRSFRMFIAIFLFGQCGIDFITGLAVYYVDDVLNAYASGAFTIMMGVLLVAQFVGTIVFGQVMKKTSKIFPMMIGIPLEMAALAGMLMFSHEGANFTIILIFAFFIGIGMAAANTCIFAIMPDMADVDELITGISRPGTCSGMATFARKIAGGLSAAMIGFLLALVGYDEIVANSGLRQTASVQSGIAFIFIFVPMIMLVFTLYFAARFPLKKKQFDMVRKETARRREEDPSDITPEEKKVLEKVTGFAYEKLWDKNNALRL